MSEFSASFPSPRFTVIHAVVRMRAREVLKGGKGGREMLKERERHFLVLEVFFGTGGTVTEEVLFVTE